MSLMDRTKRQVKAAREQQRRDDNDEDDVQDLEEVVRQARERVKAAKTSKSRAAALRFELQELQEEERSIVASEDIVPISAPAPAPDISDPSAFLAASLQSAVCFYLIIYLFTE